MVRGQLRRHTDTVAIIIQEYNLFFFHTVLLYREISGIIRAVKQNIGLYPGTFDPIHKGHIGFALAAAEACGLDLVAFLPEHTPRRKQGVTPLLDRLDQIEQALAPHANLTPLTIHTRQFTYQSSMSELRSVYGDDVQFTLLMGSDVAKGLKHGWEDADKLFAECKIAIGLRNDDTMEEVSEALLHTPSARSVILSTDYPYESSSLCKKEGLN